MLHNSITNIIGVLSLDPERRREMNNFEKLKGFTLDQMVAFIAEIDEDCSTYCRYLCPHKVDEYGCRYEDNTQPCESMSKEECIKAWLEADTPIPQ